MNRTVLGLMDSVLPDRLLSRLVGHAARARVPHLMLRPFLYWYANHFGVNLEEAEFPLEAYPTFVDFFTRELRPGIRPFDANPDALTSPVDGALYASGTIEHDTFLLAKGHSYTVGELLGDEDAAASFVDGTFMTIYLSPKDYHRIHSPCDATISRFLYVPGKLLPVNPPSAAFFPKLFCENERLTTFLERPDGGHVALVKVGATNVGRIRLSYHPFVTNQWMTSKPFGVEHLFTPPLSVERGEELAMFEMGSTVVLLFSKGTSIESFEIDEVLRLGQRIAMPPGAIENADSE